MSNPFKNLRRLNDVVSASDWAAGLKNATDLPGFPGVNRALRLSQDRSMLRIPARRLFADYRSNPHAFRTLKTIPGEEETLHAIISGQYALFDLIPGLIERTGQAIDELYIATLGFSRQNGADLCGLLDGGHIRRLALVCSHYFAETSSGVYLAVTPELLVRGHRVMAMRSHAKLLVVRMKDGAHYVVEASANLRSCGNVEQFTLTRSTVLYRFHQDWLEEEILRHARGHTENP